MQQKQKRVGGQKIGRLRLVQRIVKPEKAKPYYWVCVCDCGSIAEIPEYAFSVKQPTESCGCILREIFRKKSLRHGESVNGKLSPEYSSYRHMKARCCIKTNKKYPSYGGRGIKICDRWLESFSNFLEDMGRKPSKECTLGRIDNDGNYEPSNCRWETPLQQANNKRNNVFINYQGESFTIAQFARKVNMSPDVVGIKAKRTLEGEYIIKNWRNPLSRPPKN